jgi:hypothetical protein
MLAIACQCSVFPRQTLVRFLPSLRRMPLSARNGPTPFSALYARKVLGIGRKVWVLSSKEDEYTPLRRELVFHALAPLPVLNIVHLIRSYIIDFIDNNASGSGPFMRCSQLF